MNILIDTNVLLDALLARKPFSDDASRILFLSEQECVTGFVSASAITDIYYLARKTLQSKESAREAIRDLLRMVSVAAVDGQNISEALDVGWSDFEDAVQYSAGKSVNVAYIVTRNTKDFKKGSIAAIEPSVFLDKLGNS